MVAGDPCSLSRCAGCRHSPPSLSPVSPLSVSLRRCTTAPLFCCIRFGFHSFRVLSTSTARVPFLSHCRSGGAASSSVVFLHHAPQPPSVNQPLILFLSLSVSLYACVYSLHPHPSSLSLSWSLLCCAELCYRCVASVGFPYVSCQLVGGESVSWHLAVPLSCWCRVEVSVPRRWQCGSRGCSHGRVCCVFSRVFSLSSIISHWSLPPPLHR